MSEHETKVKICGITNLEDALLSVKFGADALGFNFYPKSPRYISPENAAKIVAELPKGILKVGVFVNEDLEKIAEIAEIAKLDAIQLHGDETPDFARAVKEKTTREVIKALRVSAEFQPEDVLKFNADAILLDAFSPKERGGTGETFDWAIAKKVQEIFPKMYLAGGLSPDNVSRAILEVKPYAVDACSCLESEKGKKDKTALINFVSNVVFSNRVFFDMDNLLYLLRLFRYRPKLYFPEKSITQICSFICGYYSALDSKSDFNSPQNLFRQFDDWIGIKRGMFIQSVFSYSEFMLEKANGNEEKAFDIFFALLEEFLLEKEDSNND